MKKQDYRESCIPQFSSCEEEAAFWDTHDTTDFEDEFKPVKVSVARDLSEGVTVPLDDETLEQLRAAARAAGTDTTALVRQWIAENLARFRRPS